MINNKILKYIIVAVTTTILTACGGGGSTGNDVEYTSGSTEDINNDTSGTVLLKNILLDSKDTQSEFKMLMFNDGETLVLNKNELYDISEPTLKKLPNLDVEGTFIGLSLDDKIFYSESHPYNYRTDISILRNPKNITSSEGLDTWIKEPVIGLLQIGEDGFSKNVEADHIVFATSNNHNILYMNRREKFIMQDISMPFQSDREFRYNIANALISKDKHYAYIIEKYTGLKIADVSNITSTLPLVGQVEFKYDEPEGAALSDNNKTLYVWSVTNLYTLDVSNPKNPKIVKTIDAGDYTIRKFIPSVDDSRGYLLVEKDSNTELFVIKL